MEHPVILDKSFYFYLSNSNEEISVRELKTHLMHYTKIMSWHSEIYAYLSPYIIVECIFTRVNEVVSNFPE